MASRPTISRPTASPVKSKAICQEVNNRAAEAADAAVDAVVAGVAMTISAQKGLSSMPQTLHPTTT
jgi:hypothetical protein